MTEKGLAGWVEVFRGGPQVDRRGRTHDGDLLIEKALQGFDPGKFEPPLVVGHPKDDRPAYGWVSALRRRLENGRLVLEARFRQVAPEFEDWVRRGLYKNRSAGFFPDGRLRHVGFLGAAPPAVAGLRPISFAAAAGPEFTQTLFHDPNQEEEQMTFKDFWEAFKLWKADQKTESPLGASEDSRPELFTKAQLEEAVRKALAEQKAADEARRIEAEREKERDRSRREMETRVDALVAQGKLPPALVDMGLKEFMAGLGGPGFEFSAGSQRRGESLLEWFYELLARLEKLGLFQETASGNPEGKNKNELPEDEKLGDSIAAKVSPRTAAA